MGRKPSDSEPIRWGSLILLLMGIISCSVVYFFMSSVLRNEKNSDFESLANLDGDSRNHILDENSGCCKGIQQLELWGDAVKWGSDFKLNSSEECCKACKRLCNRNDGPCLCDTWVFCGNKEMCGSKFGEVSWFS